MPKVYTDNFKEYIPIEQEPFIPEMDSNALRDWFIRDLDWEKIIGTTKPADNATYNTGALADKDSVDLATGEVTNKSADNIAESASKKWAGETGADVTSAHTANDTSNVNSKAADLVQERAENHYIKGYFNGSNQDGLTETAAGTGYSVTRQVLDTYLFANSDSASGNVQLYTADFGILADDWDNDFEFTCKLQSSNNYADSGAFEGGTMAFGLWNNALGGPGTGLGTNGVTFTTRHIAFIIGRDNNVYASNANGTNQTTTNIGITHTNMNTYKIVWDNGTNIKFYVNDTLEATHTTNLPSGSTNKPDIHFSIQINDNANNSNRIDTWFKVYNNYKVIAL